MISLRWAWFALAAILLSGATTAEAQRSGGSPPGLKDGFRSFHWGSKPTKPMKQMGKIGMKASMDMYALPWGDEDRRVAGADKAFIEYLYYRGSLCRVEVWWPKLKKYEREAIPEVLKREWGPAKEISIIGSHTWVSANGRTEAHFSALEDSTGDYLATLIMQEIKCSTEAINDAGVSR